ncbi:MAG: hypothetical protein BRD37_03330 [Bacteroidetes bacterium QH_8_67_23]|nr:MAG: hypothetical protein BRD37_03330 [Bacteroidetes bacterium QH_8_67_23]
MLGKAGIIFERHEIERHIQRALQFRCHSKKGPSRHAGHRQIEVACGLRVACGAPEKNEPRSIVGARNPHRFFDLFGKYRHGFAVRFGPCAHMQAPL